MARLEINATFIGRDGSCGYTNGRKYKLEIMKIEGQNEEKVIIPKIRIECSEALSCEYQSLKSFLNNWTLIELSK